MFHRAITPLFSMAVFFLIAIGSSICRPLLRQSTLSQPSSSLHRYLRRSTPSLSSSSHYRRSISDDSDDPFSLFGPISLDAEDSDNWRRSIDTEPAESQGDFSPESINQEKADAEKDWSQFVTSAPDEDSDSYPDSFAQDDDSDSSCSEEVDASDDTPQTSASLTTSNKNNQVNSPSSQDAEYSKPQKSNYSGPDKQQGGEAAKQKQAEATKQKQAEAAKKEEAEAAKEKEAETAKKEEAEAAKRKQGEADDQKKAEQEKKEAEEDKEKKAEQDKKKAEDDKKKAEEEKQKVEEEKEKKTEDEAAKAAEEAQKKQAVQPPTSPDNYQGDVKPIPGTSVTTGTVHKDHKDDSYSTPSPEKHNGDATYYEPGLGACGLTNTSSDMIVAVSKLLYDTFPAQGGNPNTNQVCGKRIRATYKGQSCEVTVVDRCEACEPGDLDFTITAFEKLGNKDEGRLHGMTWTFI